MGKRANTMMVSPHPPRHVDGAFARLVADGARHHRGSRCEDSRECHHKSGRPCLVHKLVLHELGEIHVFDDPGDLPDEPEKEKAEPDFAAERRRLGRSGIRGDFPDHMLTLRKVLGVRRKYYIHHTSGVLRRSLPPCNPFYNRAAAVSIRKIAPPHVKRAFFPPSAASARYRDFDGGAPAAVAAAFRQI